MEIFSIFVSQASVSQTGLRRVRNTLFGLLSFLPVNIKMKEYSDMTKLRLNVQVKIQNGVNRT